MTDVVINKRHGGFGISDEAAQYLCEKHGWTLTAYNDEGNYENPDAEIVDRQKGPNGNEPPHLGPRYVLIDKREPEVRSHPDLVDCVETLGSKASGEHASLKVVEIPDDVEYEIKEYDGAEWVAEKHRTWG